MKGMRRKGSDAGSAGTKEEQDVEVLQPSAGTAILEQSELAQMFNHRRLTGRQIQLIAIAGTIGAALFVGIGSSLRNGGPLSLLIGISIWSSVIFAVAQCQVETVTLLPIDGSFVRLTGRFVDEALGVAAGWNYFLNQIALISFDVVAFTTIIGYWYELNPAILNSVLIATYLGLNIWSVSIFGEVEFWLACGKVFLVFLLMGYTFVTMLGGNPLGDRYGFRYFKDPGPMVEYLHDGALGRFEGVVACIIGASFIIAGPEYISMAAGEARNPRKIIPKAFNSITLRLVVFFVIGALCVGIVCPSNAPELLGSLGVSAAQSPYTIGMNLLEIKVLPDIVNALIGTSVASAASSYVYTSSRTLYSLANAGQAPKVLRRLNRKGTPWVCVLVSIALACLSYLSVSAGTNKVLTWFINLVTASQLLNWIFMSLTWIGMNRAIKKQGLDRKTFLPHTSRFQPYAAWYALIMASLVLFFSGYELFLPGKFAADSFIFTYGMVFVSAFVYLVWKAIKRTPLLLLRPDDVDLVSGLEAIDTYTEEVEALEAAKHKTRFERILDRIF